MTQTMNKILICTVSYLVITGTSFFSVQDTPDREKKIREAISRAEKFLTSIQRPDGSIRDTANPLFETWETALAATALFEIQGDTNDHGLRKALAFLRANENKDGLVCHNVKCKESFCLETSAVYLSLLNATGQGKAVKQRLLPVLSWQKTTGQWEIGNPDVREQKEFPSVTAFVLSSLSDAGLQPVNEEKAIDWLLKQQHPEGHWGMAWEYYGCPAYALWPVMRYLSGRTGNAVKAARERSLAYMRSRQLENGSWFDANSHSTRTVSASLQTALMLTALRFTEKPDPVILNKGIDFLLASQNSRGYWDGGDFPIASARYQKKEYVFATALTLSLLNWYLHHSPFSA
ncbi:MAG: terpene cyclase/mutase family protein [Chitinophagaceae bacterium]|nr:terpene cyclase/mutase family protein [Chitinophagaceae bacterium]